MAACLSAMIDTVRSGRRLVGEDRKKKIGNRIEQIEQIERNRAQQIGQIEQITGEDRSPIARHCDERDPCLCLRIQLDYQHSRSSYLRLMNGNLFILLALAELAQLILAASVAVATVSRLIGSPSSPGDLLAMRRLAVPLRRVSDFCAAENRRQEPTISWR